MKQPATTALAISADYRRFVEELKARVQSARLSAARAITHEAILLYWDIGRGIVEKQQTHSWGDSVVEMVAADLRRAFPGMRGFSANNLWLMRQFYSEYSAAGFLEQLVQEIAEDNRHDPRQTKPVTQPDDRSSRLPLSARVLEQLVQEILPAVPWGHHVEIVKKVKTPAARLWYLRATSRFGWSRNVLLNQIKAGAYERAVTEKKTHNFPLALPEYLAEQADEMLKSSYNLEFLGIRREVKERELEDRLVSRLQAFLLELGYGFCFVGRQYRLALGEKEYFIDLLFYHRFIKALIAFELKVGPFEPEHAGKMDFYLNLLNDRERGPDDQPSIGIILCAEKDDVEVEYALRSKANPIGVASYELQSKLPGELKGKLPTAKQLADVVRIEMEGEV
ncbi:PDDEXK nuclease domain-containing protein [uncultured Thiocystis sp.]|jgi:predicted nuclease of restriction endonuclease-like (RecB) superfamily|uniref:PDDEXK nuclease domain-containing protein n=1 Tax=uncultured Thiocystis sp. TaxID=1202134 RepID=UPI0025E2C933|nr:PDDEXK nuclease domain-containing protein [uncultured Thiocystis sp.]